MKKIFTLLAVAAMAAPLFAEEAERNYVEDPHNPTAPADFIPTEQNRFAQDLIDNDHGDKMVSEVRIEVKFPEDVYWVPGASKYCYLLDSKGEKVERTVEGKEVWWPDFGGPADDYSKFYFSVRGLNKYVDADYTLVIPECLYGNNAWHKSLENPRRNPELRYDFNLWELSGKPREDLTKYDFNPKLESTEVVTKVVKGKKVPELDVVLSFTEPVFISDNFDYRNSVWDPEEKYVSGAEVKAEVMKDAPEKVFITVKEIDFTVEGKYVLSFAKGAFGNKKWTEEQYCDGNANPEVKFEVEVKKPSGISEIDADEAEAPLYNLQGVRVTGDRLPSGVYIRAGKKILVK